MKVTIAGAGAMGCRLGAALAGSGHDVLLLDGWDAHVASISAHGLRVTDEEGTRTVRIPAALFPAAGDPADLVIVFAKATATSSVAAAPATALAVMKAQFDPAASGSHLASTLQDLLNGRPTEIAHLNGAVASRAVSHGIAAPANSLITSLVELLEATRDRRVTSIHA